MLAELRGAGNPRSAGSSAPATAQVEPPPRMRGHAPMTPGKPSACASCTSAMMRSTRWGASAACPLGLGPGHPPAEAHLAAL